MPSTDLAVNTEATNKDTLRDSSGRVSQFSYIRIIACFAIVLLHCVNAARVYHADTISEEQTVAAFTVCSMLMWAVPCFLMVTGALLLDPKREIPLSKLFGKYIRRVAVALVLFTFIFTLIKHDPAGGQSIVHEFIDGLLFNHCMAYLWYLYLMIALYLLMPLFKAVVNRLSRSQLRGVTGALLALSSLLPLCGYLGVEGKALGLLPYLVYPAYLFIGYLLFGKNADLKASAAVPAPTKIAAPVPTTITAPVPTKIAAPVSTTITVFVLTTIALGCITYFLMPTDIDPSGLTGYNSLLVVLQSAAAFSMMLRIKKEAGSLARSLDSCTFGIYLVHMIFVRLTLKELGFDPFSAGPASFVAIAASFVAMAVLFFFASYAVALPVVRAKKKWNI